jgi:hypothetical protein
VPPRPPGVDVNARAVANAQHEGRYLVIGHQAGATAETLALSAQVDARGDRLRAALRRGIEAALLESALGGHAQLSIYRAELAELDRLDALEDERCYQDAPRRLTVISTQAREGLGACEVQR